MHEIIDRQRQRLRLARYVAREQDCCSEFSQSTGKRQQSARDDAFVSQRDGDDEENFQRRSAQGRSNLLQPHIDLGKRGPDRAYEQRKGHHRHGDEHPFPVENDFYAALVQPLTERAPPAEDLQQDQTCRNRRHDKRQKHHGFDDAFQWPFLAGEEPRQRDTKRQNQERARKSDGNRKEGDLPRFKGRDHETIEVLRSV